MFYSSNQPNIHKQFNVPQSTNRPSHNKFVNILLQRGIKIDLCGSPCTFHITLNAQVFGSHTKATNHWQSDKSCHSKAITQQEYNYRSNQLTNSVCRLVLKLCNLKNMIASDYILLMNKLPILAINYHPIGVYYFFILNICWM